MVSSLPVIKYQFINYAHQQWHRFWQWHRAQRDCRRPLPARQLGEHAISLMPKCWTNFILLYSTISERNNSHQGGFGQYPAVADAKVASADTSWNRPRTHPKIVTLYLNWPCLSTMWISIQNMKDSTRIGRYRWSGRIGRYQLSIGWEFTRV